MLAVCQELWMTPYPEFKGTSLFDVDYFGYDMATVIIIIIIKRVLFTCR